MVTGKGHAEAWPFFDYRLAVLLETTEAASTLAYARSQAQVSPDARSAQLELGCGAVAVYCGPGSPVSRALGLGMSGPVAAAQLDGVEEFYISRGELPRVDLCPLADSTLFTGLASRGYVVAGLRHVSVLPIALVTALELHGCSCPDHNVTVASVNRADAAAVETWLQVVSSGFAGSDYVGDGNCPAAPAGAQSVPAPDTSISRPAAFQPGCWLLLASINGQPAGAGVLEVREGLGLLRSQSTLPRYRGQGVQAQVIRASLRIAQEAGCWLAVVQTAPGSGSQRNMERAGFRIAYTKPTLERRRDSV